MWGTERGTSHEEHRSGSDCDMNQECVSKTGMQCQVLPDITTGLKIWEHGMSKLLSVFSLCKDKKKLHYN